MTVTTLAKSKHNSLERTHFDPGLKDNYRWYSERYGPIIQEKNKFLWDRVRRKKDKESNLTFYQIKQIPWPNKVYLPNEQITTNIINSSEKVDSFFKKGKYKDSLLLFIIVLKAVVSEIK